MEHEAREVRAADHRFEHGLHAFIFLSFIFAETIKLNIETVANFFRSSIPVSVLMHWPEAALLFFAVTVLTLQYWWVIFESASFYGDNFGNFLLGVLEAGVFYAVAVFLKGVYRFLPEKVAKYILQTSRVFRVFIGLIILFIVIDAWKYAHYGLEDKQTKKKLRIREGLRIIGLILCLFGAFWRYPTVAASLFFLLALGYTIFSKKLGSGAPPR